MFSKYTPPACVLILSCLSFFCRFSHAQYFPADNSNWETVSISETGADAVLIQEAVDYAGSNNSNALVILHGGKILIEEYWNDWDRTTRGPSYSAAKSVASVLVGQAIEMGFIEGLDQPAADFLEEWADEPTYQNILIRHQLSMTTGFEENPATLWLLHQAVSERRFATRQINEFPPGTRWYYNDAAYRLLFYIIEEAAGTTLPQFSETRLFSQIGMNDTEWVIREETQGDVTYENYEWLRFTALDAARFGLLARNLGNWNGQQIVRRAWMETSIVPQFDMANWYGRLWWLNGVPYHKVPGKTDLKHGSFVPDVPPDMFAALGALDQKIYVIPSLDLVVVRLGEAALESSIEVGIFDNLMLGRICHAFGYEGQKQDLVLDLTLADDTLDLEFPAWKGRHYTLMQSGDLVNWTAIGEYQSILGDGTMVDYGVSVNNLEPEVFYRVQSVFDPAQ